MNKINARVFFITALIATVYITAESCVSHDFPEYTCSGETISFTDQVRPIITEKCAIPDCHNGDNGPDKNWTNFSLFQNKSAEAKRRVTHRIMPPAESTGGPLSQEQINTIACWVDQGSQDN
jgi:hypothetical protein